MKGWLIPVLMLGSAAQAQVTWDVQPAWTLPMLSLDGVVSGPGGGPLGEIRLTEGQGTGTIRWPGGDGRVVPLALTAEPRGEMGVEIDLRPTSGRIEDEMAGRLLLARTPGGRITGTLLTEVGFTEVALATSAPLRVEPPEPEPDERDSHDAPAFGVTKSYSHLRGVPSGQNLTLRAAPSREARSTGSTNANASGLLVIECTPQIDQIAFEEAPHARKLALLDALWCHVTVPMAGDAFLEGWVPGRYLEPDA